MMYASRLTWSDRKQADALLGGEPQLGVTDTTVLTGSTLVVNLFAGIGGLEEALKRAGIGKHYTVFVEVSRECRRLLKRRYPAMHIVNDIKEFGREVLERAFEMCPNAEGIIVGGCPPCQSLGVAQGQLEESGESVRKFFPDVVKVFMVVDEVARERGIWTLKLMENVVTALDDLEQMSVALKMRPVMVDSGDIIRASRPRMYWVSRPIQSRSISIGRLTSFLTS